MTIGTATEAYLPHLDAGDDLIYVTAADLDPQTTLFKQKVASLPLAAPVAPLSEKKMAVIPAATIEEEIAALLDAEDDPAYIEAAQYLMESDESASESSSPPQLASPIETPSPTSRSPSLSIEEEIEAFFDADAPIPVIEDLDALNAL